MYCKKCGSYISNDSVFCNKCGARQGNSSLNIHLWTNHIQPFYKAHKIVSIVYLVWVLIHLTLFILSSLTYYNSRGGYSVDLSSAFYPYDESISDILKGCSYRFSFIDNIDVYDFSEFFVYTFVIPFAIYGIKKGIESLSFSIKKRYNNKRDRLSGGECVTIKDKKLYPLGRRFIGSMIDKILIIAIFLLVYNVVNPFSCMGKLGSFMGLVNTSPHNYEYIDKALMDNYGKYYEGIDKEYQDLVRQEEGEPYIGYTKDLEMNIVTIFILINLLYYMLFELILCASPGKWIGGGKLDNSANMIHRFGIVLFRGLIGAAIMVFAVVYLRFQLELNYYFIIIIFFLILDLPLFFTKRSLLDICTGTRYIYC